MRTIRLLAGIAALLPAATAAAAGNITIKGSDTMVILGQRWAEEYMKKNPDTVHPGDRRRLGHRHQRAHQRHDRHLPVVALDEGRREGEAARPLQHHRRRDPGGEGRPGRLRATRRTRSPSSRWSSSRGSSPARSRTGRSSAARTARSSPTRARTAPGTYVFFKEHVLGGADFTPRAQTMPGTAAVVNAVAKEKFGIGYGGAAYAKGIKILKVKKDAASAGHRARQDHRAERHLPAVAPAVLLPAQQAGGGHQGVHRLGAVARRPGGRRQGRLLPGEVSGVTAAQVCAPHVTWPPLLVRGRVTDAL